MWNAHRTNVREHAVLFLKTDESWDGVLGQLDLQRHREIRKSYSWSMDVLKKIGHVTGHERIMVHGRKEVDRSMLCRRNKSFNLGKRFSCQFQRRGLANGVHVCWDVFGGKIEHDASKH